MLYISGEETLECPNCGAEIFPDIELVHEIDLGEVIHCPICEEESPCEDFDDF